uniref:Uncharacterized protein n=1 Tax=Anguilla anguilla TaxID=7936 RepID=A0A0E9TCW9_ANGAN
MKLQNNIILTNKLKGLLIFMSFILNIHSDRMKTRSTRESREAKHDDH